VTGTADMTSTAELRAVMTGLAGFAAVQEQLLLAGARQAEPGDASCWAALPTVAHNTEFARQQVQRLRAIRSGQEPPEFEAADHRSAALYAELTAQPADSVARDSWRVSGELLEEIRSAASDDLLDPARHPWLRGRQLWLQVIVRGFWHPAGHLGEYYLSHGQADQAVTLAEQAVELTASLGAPAQARGMASYNLACARSGAGLLDEAAAAVAEAIALNPDVADNAARDPDLASLRDSGRMPALPGL
jgi:tetratricopeptide (TPR) repeat protein